MILLFNNFETTVVKFEEGEPPEGRNLAKLGAESGVWDAGHGTQTLSQARKVLGHCLPGPSNRISFQRHPKWTYLGNANKISETTTVIFITCQVNT